jgi:hypothetical protein
VNESAKRRRTARRRCEEEIDRNGDTLFVFDRKLRRAGNESPPETNECDEDDDPTDDADRAILVTITIRMVVIVMMKHRRDHTEHEEAEQECREHSACRRGSVESHHHRT